MKSNSNKTDVNLLARRLNISIALTVAVAFIVIIIYTSYRNYVLSCDSAGGTDRFIVDEVSVVIFATLVMVIMQYSLRRIIRRITTPVVNNVNQTEATNRTLESELDVAHRLQKSLLPRPFAVGEIDGVNVKGYLRTARQVGGDLYDYVLNGRTLFFAIGDVSGKGVPGALTMATTQRLLRTLQKVQPDITAVMSTLNDALCETNESNQFVTLIIGKLNLDTGKLTICNAGHNAPFIVERNGNVRPLELKTNIPVGVFPQYHYKADHLRLKNKLILYTDGVTEAESAQREMYGMDNLHNIIRSIAERPISELVDGIVEDGSRFTSGAEQRDDIAILGIELVQTHAIMEKTLTLPNNLGAVDKVTAMVEEVGELVRLSPGEVSRLTLALEEAVVNVVSYAYPKDARETFTLYVKATDTDLVFTLVDHGSPFDPTVVPDPDVTADAFERPIGGLGIMIVKKCMSSVIYERDENENRLLMIYNYKKTR